MGLWPRRRQDHQNTTHAMRPVEFGEALPFGTRLTLISYDRASYFTVVNSWTDQRLGLSLRLGVGIPCYQVEDEEGRTELLLHLPMNSVNEGRWRLWRPGSIGPDFNSFFDAALIEE
jgi:hypothetical protein